MAWAWTTNILFNVAGALAIVAFGVFVATVRARTPQASAVALFSIAFGVATGCFNLAAAAGFEGGFANALLWTSNVALMAMLGTLVRLWWILPSPLTRQERPLLIAPALFIAWWLVVVVPALLPLIAGDAQPPMAFPLFLYGALVMLGVAAWWGLLTLLALRVGRGAPAPELRGQTPLLAAALTLYPATAARFVFSPESGMATISWFGLGFTLLLAGLWIWAWNRAGAPRVGRNLAWLTLAMALVSLLEGLQGVTFTTGSATGAGLQGISRIATVALLSYAVVRHHVLGLDVKVRWTLSRSTVAAAFVAAFFVASEGAQQFFGESLGSAYVGIAAAGALVFALAPLQRAAERLAEKAVPVATPTSTTAPTYGDAARGEASYRKAVRLAMRDRRISREEETHLHELARDLGIDGARAHAILVEVEAEASGGAPK